MFGSEMLDVAVGLVFIYLLFSFVATAARETLESWLKTRGAYLERGLISLIADPDNAPPVKRGKALRGLPAMPVLASETAELLEKLYHHPLIFGLFRGGYVSPNDRNGKTKSTSHLPSYIPAANFAQAILEVAHGYANEGTGGAPQSMDRLKLAVEALPNDSVRKVLRTAIRAGGGDPDKTRKYIEDWYAGGMDRVAGWYKRHTQNLVLIGSLILAVALNVNTITIVQALSQHSALRAALVSHAEQANRTGTVGPANGSAPANASTPPAVAQPTKDALQAELDAVKQVGLPIGWDEQTRKLSTDLALAGPRIGEDDRGAPRTLPLGWIALALGWAMTGLAISLGAPFWFDILNKIMVVRATVKPREKSVEESPKDPTNRRPPGDDDDRGGGGGAGKSETELPPPVPKPPNDSAVDADDLEEIRRLDPALRPREED